MNTSKGVGILYYNKSDLSLLHMKKLDTRTGYIISGSKISTTTPVIFEIERKLTIDEKIAFIDNHQDNIASYLLYLITKWEKAKYKLEKGDNEIVMRKKREWLERYDTRCFTKTTGAATGAYQLFRTIYHELAFTCPRSVLGHTLTHTGKHIVEQWFHDLLVQLHREEMQYISRKWVPSPIG